MYHLSALETNLTPELLKEGLVILFHLFMGKREKLELSYGASRHGQI
jgi:hypothetical protein